MPKRKTTRKTRHLRKNMGFGNTQKIIGQSTKAIVGVTAFTVTANALTEIAK